jgi:hypothetical protein
MRAADCAEAAAAGREVRWPLAIWAASWASTDCTWSGLSSRISSPEWMNTCRASATKALSEPSLMMMTCVLCGRPASRKTGAASSLNARSISASRMMDWAAAATGARATSVASAAARTSLRALTAIDDPLRRLV